MAGNQSLSLVSELQHAISIWPRSGSESGHGEASAGNHDSTMEPEIKGPHFRGSHEITESGHGEARARNHDLSI